MSSSAGVLGCAWASRRSGAGAWNRVAIIRCLSLYLILYHGRAATEYNDLLYTSIDNEMNVHEHITEKVPLLQEEEIEEGDEEEKLSLCENG